MLINDASITGSLTVNANSTFNGAISAQSITGSISATNGIVSGSSQITTLLPTGIVSGSSQVLGGSGIWSGSSQLPTGIISGSSQLPTLATTGSNTFNGTQIITGSLVITGSVSIISTAALQIGTGSGDEGGEILLIKSQTNNSLTGSGITIDSYQNRVRIFEQGGNTRGAYLNVTSQSNSVGSIIVTSPNLASIQTLTSASYAALTPASGTLYIIIG